MSDKDIIEEAQEAYKAAVDADADIHRDWVEDMRFARLGEHWPAEVKRQRELEAARASRSIASLRSCAR